MAQPAACAARRLSSTKNTSGEDHRARQQAVIVFLAPCRCSDRSTPASYAPASCYRHRAQQQQRECSCVTEDVTAACATMALLLRGCVAGVAAPAAASDGAAAAGGYGVLGGPNGSIAPPAAQSNTIETTVERVIFDFRFLALLAVAGSLAGSLLCFLNGCVFIKEAYSVYWSSCAKGVHTGQMVLKVVEAIDVYLAGTVMLIFGMGLYGLFISNASTDASSESDRALKVSSLFGMFALKGRPTWMKITSLDELKTKVGHVIVMILLVKMFERSKMVTIATGLDLLSYSVCIFLSSASLYILHNLHKGGDHDEDDL